MADDEDVELVIAEAEKLAGKCANCTCKSGRIFDTNEEFLAHLDED